MTSYSLTYIISYYFICKTLLAIPDKEAIIFYWTTISAIISVGHGETHKAFIIEIPQNLGSPTKIDGLRFGVYPQFAIVLPLKLHHQLRFQLARPNLED